METGNRITIQLIENFLLILYKRNKICDLTTQFLNATGRIRANDIKVVDENNLIIYESPSQIMSKDTLQIGIQICNTQYR